MSEVVYLNGRFLKSEDASLSPNDRGFIFADGVYEVTKYYYGKPFRFDDHVKRLKRSLKELRIKFDQVDELQDISRQLIELNKLQNKHAGVYWQITRGVNKRIHHFPQGIPPTFYAFAFPLPSDTEKQEKGIDVILREDIRWQRCDIKSVSLLPNTMLYNEAVEKGAGECILERNGYITEATHSSVIAVKNGVVITHPLSNLILPGITRKVVLELCAGNQIPAEERFFTENELFEMDELFICGTGSEITPVISVDDKKIGTGHPGKITQQLQRLFFETAR